MGMTVGGMRFKMIGDKIKEKADKMRALTDEKLVAYVENRVKKAYSEGFNKGRKTDKQEVSNGNR